MAAGRRTRQEKMFMLLDAVDKLREDLALFPGDSPEELEFMLVKALGSVDNLRTRIEDLDA
jgi:hypothetical protein